MSLPVKTDVVKLGIDSLLTQWQDKPVALGLLKSYLENIQIIEDVQFQVLEERGIDRAIGVQLDNLGLIVGQPRTVVKGAFAKFFGFQGNDNSSGFGDDTFFLDGSPLAVTKLLDDDQYRFFIKARAASNTSSGTPEDLIKFFQSLFGASTNTIVKQTSTARATVLVGHIFTGDEKLLILSDKENSFIPRPAGVSYTFEQMATNRYFGFSADSRAEGFSRGGFISLLTPEPFITLLDTSTGLLDPSVIFTRASAATLTNSDLILAQVATDVPRITDYDPITGQPLGFLIEEQRTNLLTYSEQFDNAAWGKTNTTVTANTTISPDGTTTMDSVFETAVTGEHYVRQNYSGLTANTINTITIYVSDLNGRNLNIRVLDQDNAGNGFSATFSPALGTIIDSAYNIGNGVAFASTIKDVGNGIYRVRLSGNGGATCTRYIVDFFTTPVGGGLVFLGDVTKGLKLWGAKLEQGATPTSYNPTVAAASLRARDIATITDLTDINFNTSEGSLVVEFVAPSYGTSGLRGILNISDGTTIGFIYISMMSQMIVCVFQSQRAELLKLT
jgi:hypothetical protein